MNWALENCSHIPNSSALSHDMVAHDQLREVDQLMGAALLLRRRGPGRSPGAFDERFFMYFEEVDSVPATA